ncbi:acyltransferase family protein [Deminuibacter soli]|uniref:Acyltransferase 3 domain-containing protein n=1 Tax=Deminuibacter soli TaxID=2291815 RepID=A0A3E1NQI3_9BACT|nr:acyltransferase family protein [Deminuibacter soli]RFM30186.1 hypothetical protein DXN05_04230 [Deminuibacter soli]
MNTNERIHGLDALRTIAMGLGIVLHAIIAYKQLPEANWPHDSLSSPFLEWLYRYIHHFRMPLFYLVAGFFTRLVILRSGTRYFAEQRFKRIVIPFLFGLVFIVPLSTFPFNYNHFRYDMHLDAATALSQGFRQMFHWNGLVHLWFLYYLIIFYTAALALLRVFKHGKTPAPKSSKPVTLLHFFGAVAFLTLLLFVFKMQQPGVYTGIKPRADLFCYHGSFFFAGWLMNRYAQTLAMLTRHGVWFLAAGTAIAVIGFTTAAFDNPVAGYSLSAAETTLLVAGFTGVFVRFCNTESKIWRYCSDAAYWVYLVHISCVAALQVALLNSALPVVSRMPVVLLITLTISLLSYELFVRYTIIGYYLHGKRKRSENQSAVKKSGGLTTTL